jgi:hypothetical protein
MVLGHRKKGLGHKVTPGTRRTVSQVMQLLNGTASPSLSREVFRVKWRWHKAPMSWLDMASMTICSRVCRAKRGVMIALRFLAESNRLEEIVKKALMCMTQKERTCARL